MELQLVESRKIQSEPVVSGPSVTEREWLGELRKEVNSYLKVLSEFASSDPREVMGDISSIHARLVFMRIELFREGSQRAATLRTKEVDPLIEAIEFQFKVQSRIISMMDLDWKLAGGQST